MRSKPYWKNPEELAKRSGHIRRPLSLLVEYAQKGWTMETVNPFGHKSVRFAMDSIFLADLPHQAALNPVLKAMF